MKFFYTLLTLLIVEGFLPQIGRCADYWVGPKGRDVNGNGSQKSPWATLQFAADRVNPGDSVHVLNGDYTGFYLSRGGDARSPVRFVADGKAVRIIRRNRGTPDGINIEGANHVVVDGFVINEMERAGVRITHSKNTTVRRVRADNNKSWGIFTSFCDNILIEDNTATRSNREHGIYVSNSGDNPVIRGNSVSGNRMCGIHMNGDSSQGGDGVISRALIENNVIFENGKGGGSGINCDGVQQSKIQNNLLYNNHANGISLYRIDGAEGAIGNSVINNTVVQAADARWAVNIKGKSTNNLVVNNILFHNGSRGAVNIAADSLAGFWSDYNIVIDRFSPDDGENFIRLPKWQASTGMDSHSRVAKAKDVFVDVRLHDYHLRDRSPAIDAADPNRAPKQDLEGKSRPVGECSDAGAYEASLALNRTSGLFSFPAWLSDVSVFLGSAVLTGAASLVVLYFCGALDRFRPALNSVRLSSWIFSRLSVRPDKPKSSSHASPAQEKPSILAQDSTHMTSA